MLILILSARNGLRISIKKISVIGDNTFFCFSIIYRLVLGGDRVSPPFFVYISMVLSLYTVIHLFVC